MKKSKQSTPAAAIYWASQISSISFEIAFFILLGFWGDRRWGTQPWLLLAGCLLGLLTASWHLWQLVRSFERASEREKGNRK